ncbi:MAG: elongation factor Ts [Muribaculaceae bacterium]|nr:elongation factor Ts [Muribaculaceae bacterium]
MAVSIADIQKLRKLTSAGLVDCKKALIEAEGDMDKAVELVRKRGQAIAAKREDRDAAEGRALAKADGKFAAILAIKCETEPVANNEKFANLVNTILDAAMAARAKNIDDVKALTIGGEGVEEMIKGLSGITGEKMELGDYACVEGETTVAYNHFNKKLSTVVAFNKAGVDEEVAKNMAMQVASMNPMVANRSQVPQAKIDEELAVAIEKTKTEQVQKAVDNALKKAGFNPYYCATEEHRDEAIRKGYMTQEDVDNALKLMKETADNKLANLPEQMVQHIANGRLNKFFQENVLMEQEFDSGTNEKLTVAQYLAKIDKELEATDLKRVNLNAD